jgi:hypothetical protein
MSMERTPKNHCLAETPSLPVRQWGEKPNTRLLWSVVKPLRQLFKRACGNQFLEMAIDCFTQASKIFTPIDTASLQLVRKVRGGAPEARR